MILLMLTRLVNGPDVTISSPYITLTRTEWPETHHSAFRYYASVMPTAGVPIEELAEYPGRSRPVFALHVYARGGIEGRFMGPHDTPYGLREFVYTDPDGIVHRVGSPL
jgi:hypothetical protein